jgi:hypothetical protein
LIISKLSLPDSSFRFLNHSITTKQAAVYQGKLENEQFNSRDKLYGKTKEQFVEAKITKIEKKVVEILKMY